VDTVSLSIDGRRIEVPIGCSMAAAVLRAGVWAFRASSTGEPRGPLCGMGICYECRLTIDGEPHRKSCQILVREGMEVRTDGR
jgi:sarcosine oxidase subunit alpha